MRELKKGIHALFHNEYIERSLFELASSSIELDL